MMFWAISYWWKTSEASGNAFVFVFWYYVLLYIKKAIKCLELNTCVVSENIFTKSCNVIIQQIKRPMASPTSFVNTPVQSISLCNIGRRLDRRGAGLLPHAPRPSPTRLRASGRAMHAAQRGPGCCLVRDNVF